MITKIQTACNTITSAIFLGGETMTRILETPVPEARSELRLAVAASKKEIDGPLFFHCP